jgi:hypothetical protein
VVSRWTGTGTHSGPLTLPAGTVEGTGRGISFDKIRIDRHADPDEVDRIMRQDPAVKAGLFTYEIHATQTFRKASSPAPRRLPEARQRLTSIPGKLSERGSNAPAVVLTRTNTLDFNGSS